LPAKAPASHEPVVPVETTLFVAVAGIDALRGPIGKTCHRPERVASLLGVSEEDWLDPAGLAELLCHKDGGLKNVPESARVALFINKIENSDQWKAGRALAAVARVHPRVERVVLGALEPSTKGASEGEVGHDAGFEVFLGAASAEA
jgi:probable selenium-dependent hydroxylase accessory protein YqeC